MAVILQAGGPSNQSDSVHRAGPEAGSTRAVGRNAIGDVTLRISVEISPGELLDRLAILELKSERLRDPKMRQRIARDRLELVRLAERSLPASQALSDLVSELSAINAELWDLESEVRRLLGSGETGPEFACAASRIFRLNEDRSKTKAAIDRLLTGQTAEGKDFG